MQMYVRYYKMSKIYIGTLQLYYTLLVERNQISLHVRSRIFKTFSRNTRARRGLNKIDV